MKIGKDHFPLLILKAYLRESKAKLKKITGFLTIKKGRKALNDGKAGFSAQREIKSLVSRRDVPSLKADRTGTQIWAAGVGTKVLRPQELMESLERTGGLVEPPPQKRRLPGVQEKRGGGLREALLSGGGVGVKYRPLAPRGPLLDPGSSRGQRRPHGPGLRTVLVWIWVV